MQFPSTLMASYPPQRQPLTSLQPNQPLLDGKGACLSAYTLAQFTPLKQAKIEAIVRSEVDLARQTCLETWYQDLQGTKPTEQAIKEFELAWNHGLATYIDSVESHLTKGSCVKRGSSFDEVCPMWLGNP